VTPQEEQLLNSLVERVNQTQLQEKDPDAEALLNNGLGSNPDSHYILAQTVLVQKYALEQAQAQLTQAKEQIEQMQQHPEPKHATSFLGNPLGRNDAPAPPPPPPQSYAQQPGQPYPPYAPVSGYGAPQYGPPTGMGGGGFLQNAMQTATGVAAGALAFEGIESLMHGFGHAVGYGGGQGFGGFDGGQRPTEEVVNNYYGDDRGGSGDHADHNVSGAERSEGELMDQDLSSKDDRDSLYSGGDDVGSGSDNNLDDTSFDDGGSDFGDDGSGGGDDSNFA
jgi:uncharacterized protein